MPIKSISFKSILLGVGILAFGGLFLNACIDNSSKAEGKSVTIQKFADAGEINSKQNYDTLTKKGRRQLMAASKAIPFKQIFFLDTINVNNLGIVGDGKTDVTKQINNAIKHANAKNATLYFPPGKYIITDTGILLTNSNIGLIGSSQGKTIFLPGNSKTIALIQNIQNVPSLKNVLITNIYFQCTNGNNKASFALRLYGKDIEDIAIDHCWFLDMQEKYIQSRNVNRLTISNNLFTHSGEIQRGFYIVIKEGDNITIANNNFSGYYQGVYAAPEHNISNLIVRDNVFDGMWYLVKENLSAEGSSVIYTENTLSDSKIDFSNYIKDFSTEDITKWRLVRVLEARGSGRCKITADEITDTEADFITWGAIRGEIVEAGNKRGIISKVVSATKLNIEYWYDKNSLEKVPSPANEFPYKLYAVYLSNRVGGYSSQAIHVGYWHDLNGKIVIPKNGSRYELIRQLPMYALQILNNTYDITVENNRFFRNYADQISILRAGKAVVMNNYVCDGQDMGITVWNRNDQGSIIKENHIIRQGSCGITINGNNNQVSNNIINGPLPSVFLNNPNTLGAIALVGGQNNTIQNNTIDLMNAQMNGYGIAISQEIDNLNKINNNTIKNITDNKKIHLFNDSKHTYNKWQLEKNE